MADGKDENSKLALEAVKKRLAGGEVKVFTISYGAGALGTRDILAALAELPPAQREAFLLQQEGDLSVEEIARATGVNRETAKSRLRYALAKLRATLEREP